MVFKTGPLFFLSLTLVCFFNTPYGARVTHSLKSSHETSFTTTRTNALISSPSDSHQVEQTEYAPPPEEPTSPYLCVRNGQAQKCLKRCGFCVSRKDRPMRCRTTCASLCPGNVVIQCRQLFPEHLIRFLDEIAVQQDPLPIVARNM